MRVIAIGLVLLFGFFFGWLRADAGVSESWGSGYAARAGYSGATGCADTPAAGAPLGAGREQPEGGSPDPVPND